MRKQLVEYVKRRFTKRTKGLIPAFWPPVKQKDSDWKKLRNNYSQRFRNSIRTVAFGRLSTASGDQQYPGCRGKQRGARWTPSTGRIIREKGADGGDFYGFLGSKDFRPGGTRRQGWSAAAGIMAYEAIINSKTVFLQK